MLIPAVSTEECVRVLVRLGYHVAARDPQRVEVARDWHVVSVPQCEPLSPEDIARVLRDAGVSQLEFLESLEKLSTGHVPVAQPHAELS
jgi:hypothetical protein